MYSTSKRAIHYIQSFPNAKIYQKIYLPTIFKYFFKNFYENVKNIASPHYKALYLIIYKYKRNRIALKAGRAW